MVAVNMKPAEPALTARTAVSVYTNTAGGIYTGRRAGPPVRRASPAGPAQQSGGSRRRPGSQREAACWRVRSPTRPVGLTAVFRGRAHIAGLEPGAQIRLRGMVGIGDGGRRAMINPAYELLI